MTIPTIRGVDHIHVHVRDRAAARRWYEQVLGFTVLQTLEHWAVDGGPLTLEDPRGQVHLALFERREPALNAAVAFGATADQFLGWQNHFEAHAVALRLVDHGAAISMYFADPDGNGYEITTYETEPVRAVTSIQ